MDSTLLGLYLLAMAANSAAEEEKTEEEKAQIIKEHAEENFDKYKARKRDGPLKTDYPGRYEEKIAKETRVAITFDANGRLKVFGKKSEDSSEETRTEREFTMQDLGPFSVETLLKSFNGVTENVLLKILPWDTLYFEYDTLKYVNAYDEISRVFKQLKNEYPPIFGFSVLHIHFASFGDAWNPFAPEKFEHHHLGAIKKEPFFAGMRAIQSVYSSMVDFLTKRNNYPKLKLIFESNFHGILSKKKLGISNCSELPQDYYHALVIQRMWRKARYCPEYKICKKYLERSFENYNSLTTGTKDNET